MVQFIYSVETPEKFLLELFEDLWSPIVFRATQNWRERRNGETIVFYVPGSHSILKYQVNIFNAMKVTQ